MLSLLFGISIFAFALLYNSPIDPLEIFIGEASISTEQRENIIQYWNLDGGFFERYYSWLKNALHGDFGVSIYYQKDVLTVIKDRFLNSLALMGIAWILSSIFGFVLGLICAIKYGTCIDKFIKNFALLFVATPAFWLGLLMLSFFSIYLQIFPIGFASPIGKLSHEVTILDKLYHMILPVLMLSIINISAVILHTREKAIDVLNSNYILYARALGKSEFQIVKTHLVRNTIIPALTLQFASLGELFGGSILAEKVFSYPGLGDAAIMAGLNSDMALLLAISMFAVIFVSFGNLCANILYTVVNPQIRNWVTKI